jgi:hypothetical protein
MVSHLGHRGRTGGVEIEGSTHRRGLLRGARAGVGRGGAGRLVGGYPCGGRRGPRGGGRRRCARGLERRGDRGLLRGRGCGRLKRRQRSVRIRGCIKSRTSSDRPPTAVGSRVGAGVGSAVGAAVGSCGGIPLGSMQHKGRIKGTKTHLGGVGRRIGGGRGRRLPRRYRGSGRGCRRGLERRRLRIGAKSKGQEITRLRAQSQAGRVEDTPRWARLSGQPWARPWAPRSATR